jgi:uncharacterized protein YjbI with pentapeptide repeats
MVNRVREPHLAPALDDARAEDVDDDVELEHVELRGELLAANAERVTILGSRLVEVRLTGAQLPMLRLRDVVLEQCDLAGALLEGARLERCAFVDCRLSGAVLSTAKLRHVSFRLSRMDTASFRMASLETARFGSCDLRQADFYEASMLEGQLLDCDLTGADFSKARLAGTELHGSRLEGVVGAPSLRDVVIDSGQAIELGQALLAAHGVVVADEPTS